MNRSAQKLIGDKDAEKFLEEELSDYMDPQTNGSLHFEFQPKDSRVHLRLSKGLLDAIKREAAMKGISYQKYIRMTLEIALTRND